MDINKLKGAQLDWAVACCEGAPVGKPAKCSDCRFFEEQSGPDGGLYYCGHEDYTELEFWGKNIGPDYGVHDSCKLDAYAALPYSSDWKYGGPILDRMIQGNSLHIDYCAMQDNITVRYFDFHGNGCSVITIREPLLVALMRCYVSSKLKKVLPFLPPEGNCI